MDLRDEIYLQSMYKDIFENWINEYPRVSIDTYTKNGISPKYLHRWDNRKWSAPHSLPPKEIKDDKLSRYEEYVGLSHPITSRRKPSTRQGRFSCCVTSDVRYSQIQWWCHLKGHVGRATMLHGNYVHKVRGKSFHGAW